MFAGTSASLQPGTGENSPHSTPAPSADSHSSNCDVTAVGLSSEDIPTPGNRFVVGTVVEKGPFWEGSGPDSRTSGACKVVLARHGALGSEVHQPQICPKICKPRGILLRVRSLNYHFGQKASAASAAGVREQIPSGAAVCPCSVSG